jgi:hypothetical protein
LWAAALALLTTLALAPFSAAAEAPTGEAQATPTVLAVWAMLDGDTPRSGGRVRVYEKGSRSALLQSNGKAEERVYGSGVAWLEFARLPSDFTVEVSGARPGGRPLRGTFRAVVHGYTAGEVVHVDPVTTLIAAR